MSGRGRPRSASLPYVPVDPHIDTHPRTLALVDRLADETTLPATLIPTIVIRLLCHAGAQAIDGNIGHMSDGVLRRRFAPEFGFSPGALRSALTDPDCGFLVETDDGLRIHDWDDGGGRLMAQRDAWRAKKAAKTETLIFPENSPRTLPNSRPKGKGKGKGKKEQTDHSAEVEPAAEPAPPPPVGRSVDQDICQTVAALDAAPDHRPLTGASVEAIWSDAGLLGAVGAGAATGGIGKLLALCPIHAWELREALPAARDKRAPAGYAAGVIRALRAEQRQPPPRASAPAPNASLRAARGPTIEESAAAVARQWAAAVADAQLPPADADRMARFVAGGSPGPEDRRALADAPSWEAYDRWAAEQRAAGQAALAALVGGLAM